MKTFYVNRNSKGQLQLKGDPSDFEYTIHATTLDGAKKCLKMIQSAEKMLQTPTED